MYHCAGFITFIRKFEEKWKQKAKKERRKVNDNDRIKNEKIFVQKNIKNITSNKQSR